MLATVYYISQSGHSGRSTGAIVGREYYSADSSELTQVRTSRLLLVVRHASQRLEGGLLVEDRAAVLLL